MVKFIFLLSVLVGCSVARPSDNDWPKNVVTVPPNCPVGQEWVNGQCRDIWRNILDAMKNGPEAGMKIDDFLPNNVVTVPSNCRPGQVWVNGQCRDIWMHKDAMPANVVTVPPNCLPGQEYVNGECRDIWKRNPLLLEKLYNTLDTAWEQAHADSETAMEVADVLIESPNRNIINVPNQCPVGFKPDALGICRPIFSEVV